MIRRSIICTVWNESKSRLYVDQSQWTLNEIVIRRNGQTGALFERMFYDNFIVGPRCSAAVFNILSRRFHLSRLSLDFRERVGILFFNYNVHVRKRTTGRRGSPSDRFIKVVWHIRSPRLLPRPRVGNARERETRDILFYLLFHFKATSRQSFRSLARHLRRIKADGHKVRKRLVLRHLGIPADIRSTGEGRFLWNRSLRRNRSCVWFN